MERDSLTLLDDAHQLRLAFNTWRTAIEKSSKPASGRLRWSAELNLSVLLGKTGSARLANTERPPPWILELNEAKRPGNANTVTGVGRDPSGTLWLMRQGRLKANGRGLSDVSEAEFMSSTGRLPTPVRVAGGPDDRRWFKVCGLSGSREQIASETSQFVNKCAIARESVNDPIKALRDGVNFDPATEEEGRRKIWATIAVRQGQQAFRRSLLDAYEETCAITGETVCDVLEAAHIRPYNGPVTCLEQTCTHCLTWRLSLSILFRLRW